MSVPVLFSAAMCPPEFCFLAMSEHCVPHKCTKYNLKHFQTKPIHTHTHTHMSRPVALDIVALEQGRATILNHESIQAIIYYRTIPTNDIAAIENKQPALSAALHDAFFHGHVTAVSHCYSTAGIAAHVTARQEDVP
jgi:hypothetical protein